MSPFATTLLWITVGAVAVVVLAYLLIGRRRPAATTPAGLAHAQGTAADPALAVFADAGDERPTGDQIARARLGGTRGAPELGQAPLARQAREQIPHNIDGGHVA